MGIKRDLLLLIAEIEAVEKSFNWNMTGYTQVLPNGSEHFCCKICGHCPALLIERLKGVAGVKPLPITEEEINNNG